jgi:hypothetical protein
MHSQILKVLWHRDPAMPSPTSLDVCKSRAIRRLVLNLDFPFRRTFICLASLPLAYLTARIIFGDCPITLSEVLCLWSFISGSKLLRAWIRWRARQTQLKLDRVNAALLISCRVFAQEIREQVTQFPDSILAVDSASLSLWSDVLHRVRQISMKDIRGLALKTTYKESWYGWLRLGTVLCIVTKDRIFELVVEYPVFLAEELIPILQSGQA